MLRWFFCCVEPDTTKVTAKELWKLTSLEYRVITISPRRSIHSFSIEMWLFYRILSEAVSWLLSNDCRTENTNFDLFREPIAPEVAGSVRLNLNAGLADSKSGALRMLSSTREAMDSNRDMADVCIFVGQIYIKWIPQTFLANSNCSKTFLFAWISSRMYPRWTRCSRFLRPLSTTTVPWLRCMPVARLCRCLRIGRRINHFLHPRLVSSFLLWI